MTASQPPDRALARRCAGTRKRDGAPCQSRIVGADGFCSLHSPTRKVDPVELGRRGGLESGETRREQAKSVRDRLRERVEEQVELVWSAFLDGLQATTEDGAADVRTRVGAAQALLAEAYGRPPQAIVGDPEKPVAFVLDSLLARAREEDS